MLSHFSRVQFFVIPWTVAFQAPLSMGFSRQEYWSGLPYPFPGDLSHPGIKLASLGLVGGLFTTFPAPIPHLWVITEHQAGFPVSVGFLISHTWSKRAAPGLAMSHASKKGGPRLAQPLSPRQATRHRSLGGLVSTQDQSFMGTNWDHGIQKRAGGPVEGACSHPGRERPLQRWRWPHPLVLMEV